MSCFHGSQTIRWWTLSQLLTDSSAWFLWGSVVTLTSVSCSLHRCPPALACLPLKHHAPLTNPPPCCPSGQSSWKSFQAAFPRPLSLLTLSSSLLFAFPARSHDHDASGFQLHLCAYNSHIYTPLQGISLDSQLRLKTPCIILYNHALGFPYIVYHCTMSKIKASMSSLK